MRCLFPQHPGWLGPSLTSLGSQGHARRPSGFLIWSSQGAPGYDPRAASIARRARPFSSISSAFVHGPSPPHPGSAFAHGLSPHGPAQATGVTTNTTRMRAGI